MIFQKQWDDIFIGDQGNDGEITTCYFNSYEYQGVNNVSSCVQTQGNGVQSDVLQMAVINSQLWYTNSTNYVYYCFNNNLSCDNKLSDYEIDGAYGLVVDPANENMVFLGSDTKSEFYTYNNQIYTGNSTSSPGPLYGGASDGKYVYFTLGNYGNYNACVAPITSHGVTGRFTPTAALTGTGSNASPRAITLVNMPTSSLPPIKVGKSYIYFITNNNQIEYASITESSNGQIQLGSISTALLGSASNITLNNGLVFAKLPNGNTKLYATTQQNSILMADVDPNNGALSNPVLATGGYYVHGALSIAWDPESGMLYVTGHEADLYVLKPASNGMISGNNIIEYQLPDFLSNTGGGGGFGVSVYSGMVYFGSYNKGFSGDILADECPVQNLSLNGKPDSTPSCTTYGVDSNVEEFDSIAVADGQLYTAGPWIGPSSEGAGIQPCPLVHDSNGLAYITNCNKSSSPSSLEMNNGGGVYHQDIFAWNNEMIVAGTLGNIYNINLPVTSKSTVNTLMTGLPPINAMTIYRSETEN